MGIGYGFGKTLLFGEHFVVYNLPAIVSAINKKLEVIIKEQNNYTVIDNTIRFPGVSKITWEMCQKPMTNIVKYLNLTTKPLHQIIQGDLPRPHSGIGSSAAQMVAIVRALNDEFNLNLSNEQINNAAYQGEKAIHGNPSGIDNTAATYGGSFLFQKQQPRNICKKIKIKHPIRIVLADSGKATKTKSVIESVAKFKETNPIKAAAIFQQYKELVEEAYHALIDYNIVKIGNLMNKNHKLLQALTVSCPKLDSMVNIAKKSGAYGAKLTGTGRGGLMLALTPDKSIQNTVAKNFKKQGYSTFKTTIG